MRSFGVVALVVSVLTMVSSFTVDFGDTQMVLAALSLAAASAASAILLCDADVLKDVDRQ